MFIIRTLSGIGILIILIFSILFSNESTIILSLVLSLIAIYEFYSLKNIQKSFIAIIMYIYTILLYIINFFTDNLNIVLFTLVFALLTCGCIYVFRYPKIESNVITHLIFGYVYISVFFDFVVKIRQLPYGTILIWLVFISSWGTDTMAYLSGMLFGKHKLAPVLSPKKSIEGAIGGTIGACILSLIYIYVFSVFKNINIDISKYILCAGIVFVASLLSQIGDLFASAFKRNYNIKDYGKIIPGHGGVLDRFDSVLFIAPIIYTLLVMFV